MKLITSLVMAIVLGVIAIAIFIYSGIFNVAATAKDPEIVRLILEKTRVNAIQRAAKGIEVPDLDSEKRIAIGGKAFDDMCIACHSGPGKEPLVGMVDMNPPAPDLSTVVAERSSAELFWVIKNGVRMTGMPAWGASHTDEQIWDMVAFLQKLPGMEAKGFQSLIANVEDAGHDHVHGPGNGHGKMNMPATDNKGTHDNSDGHHDMDKAAPKADGHDNSDGHHDMDKSATPKADGHDNSDGHHDMDKAVTPKADGHDNSDGHHDMDSSESQNVVKETQAHGDHQH